MGTAIPLEPATRERGFGFVPPATQATRIPHREVRRDFYILLMPHATMLALSGMVEPLRVANQVAGQELYRWFTVTGDGQPIRCSNGIEIRPDHALCDLPRTAQVMVCTGVRVQETIDAATISWLRRHVQHGGGVGSLCAGVFALARAGVLRGRSFTLHWDNLPVFRELFPDLQPTMRRYEIDRGLLSCGGGYAATDMMLEIVETDHGRALAVYVADMCMYARASSADAPQKTAVAAAYGSRNQALSQSLDFMAAHLESEIRSHEMARHAGISARQLERLFRRHTGFSPMQMLLELRLSRAFALLNETNLAPLDIAVAAGFNSLPLFSRHFRRRFGCSPHVYRRGWTGARAASDPQDTNAAA